MPSGIVVAMNESQSSEPVRNEAPAAFGNGPMVPPPSRKQQSWGALISIVIIVLMVVVGAYYSWGQRLAEDDAYPALPASE